MKKLLLTTIAMALLSLFSFAQTSLQYAQDLVLSSTIDWGLAMVVR